MERYVFSGTFTDNMHDMLMAMPDFEPLDILVSQVDRNGVKKAIEWKKEGFCRWLLIDSGAFSIHTGNATTTVEEYLEFINSIDEYIDVFVQLDTIPGKFQQPKSPEDYVESANKSWDNFLYMRERVKSPEKMMGVYHYGEDISALKRMLEWKDENGKHMEYLCLSPANDVSVGMKNIYLKEMNDVIAASSNPDVKTHLLGYTSLDGLSKIKCYSADSISHRLIAGYAKILSRNFGIISVSKNKRTTSTKSNMSFVDTADEYNLSILKKEIEDLGFTLEQIQEDSSTRVVMTVHNIQKMIKDEYAYREDRVKKPKKLF